MPSEPSDDNTGPAYVVTVYRPEDGSVFSEARHRGQALALADYRISLGVHGAANVRLWLRRPDGTIEDARPEVRGEVEKLRAERDQARAALETALDTNRRLHRRCQAAESEAEAMRRDLAGGLNDLGAAAKVILNTNRAIRDSFIARHAERVERLRAVEAERDQARRERDAILNLVVQPWTRPDDGARLWKVNLAWLDTFASDAEAMAFVRRTVGLDGPRIEDRPGADASGADASGGDGGAVADSSGEAATTTTAMETGGDAS